MEKRRTARRVYVKGLVQGVGFRPYIFRLATRNSLSGWVENRNDGVTVHVEGSNDDIDEMIRRISVDAPSASQVREITFEEAAFEGWPAFEIRISRDTGDEVTEISPDIAVCADCLADMESQPHRIRYPFINCTHCGPRFTIIRDLPYDRARTTMEPFKMCPVCQAEYEDIQDRRFHAQPVACNHCGPTYTLHLKDRAITDFKAIIPMLARLIKEGHIIAMKGAGGYHLACDALNETTVNTLRQRKIRDGKPFAVMFGDIENLEAFTILSESEKRSLLSWRRPIVILRNRPEKSLATGISQGFGTTGAMLPYLPLHYLLFQELETPAIVLTSDNVSDQPIITGNDEALAQQGKIADAVLTYNRDIQNRTDDSVLFHTHDRPAMIRRSRGFVPEPVLTRDDVDGIFAAGAELVNCFCLGKGRQALLSQHIGDLKNLETLDFYQESVTLFQKIFRAKVNTVACDMHPDYLSTRFTEDWAYREGLPLFRIQHHHAHIASCMAEHGLDEKVIGIAMDGVGYGDDGTIWGGEILVCDLEGYQRPLHLEYVPQPGGDKATEEPWRMAVAYLQQYFGQDFRQLGLPFMLRISPGELDLVTAALNHNINTPLTSSAGRLFDAVAALTGICTHATFHAEAPMRLESLLQDKTWEYYPFSIGESIGLKALFENIVHDLQSNVSASIISGKFHNSIVQMILQAADHLKKSTGINKVVISGGTFQNRYLLENTVTDLQQKGFEVYTQEKVPSNDGGLALGQLAIAAKRRALGNGQ